MQIQLPGLTDPQNLAPGFTGGFPSPQEAFSYATHDIPNTTYKKRKTLSEAKSRFHIGKPNIKIGKITTTGHLCDLHALHGDTKKTKNIEAKPKSRPLGKPNIKMRKTPPISLRALGDLGGSKYLSAYKAQNKPNFKIGNFSQPSLSQEVTMKTSPAHPKKQTQFKPKRPATPGTEHRPSAIKNRAKESIFVKIRVHSRSIRPQKSQKKHAFFISVPIRHHKTNPIQAQSHRDFYTYVPLSHKTDPIQTQNKPNLQHMPSKPGGVRSSNIR